jgi:dTDP-4-amino-4,6-dideoxygalactose transaminase
MIVFNDSTANSDICLTNFDHGSNGVNYKKCSNYLQNETDYPRVFMTPSGTSSIEIMAQYLAMRGIAKIIIPSYTFTTSVLPFVERNIEVILCDVNLLTGSMRLSDLEAVYDPSIGAVLSVSYGGALPDQRELLNFCEQHNLLYLEDNAQAIGNIGYKEKYNIRPDASMSAVSFHYTKNVSCGEGGALMASLAVADAVSEIVDKGTNRQKFLNGEVEKYTCTSFGSSHIMSELNAYVLLQELSKLCEYTEHRRKQWLNYAEALRYKFQFILQDEYKTQLSCPSNGHIFGLVMDSEEDRAAIQQKLKENLIQSATHYHALSENKFLQKFIMKTYCPNAISLQQRILRLPLGRHVSDVDQQKIIDKLLKW